MSVLTGDMEGFWRAIGKLPGGVFVMTDDEMPIGFSQSGDKIYPPLAS